MNREADALWYRTVHALGLAPDLGPLSTEELRDEFLHARFEPPPKRALRAVHGGRGGGAGPPAGPGAGGAGRTAKLEGKKAAAKPGKKPRWQQSELDKLREIYPTHSNIEVAKAIQRSVKSVVSKAHMMGLRKSPSRLSEMGRQNVRHRSDRKEKG